ncbi:uncharacterized protein [Danio rerio]|uniref:Uncharacterized protein n=1 Tax=Danio rerio TaxID=7955 RepID=A0AC58IHJ3_DANRE
MSVQKHKSAETGRRLHLRWRPACAHLLCLVCRMKRDLKKLLLFSFMLILVHNVDSLNGTLGENITVRFTFQGCDINSGSSKLILHKNGHKKETCKQTEPFCSTNFVFGDVENSTVTLHIMNLTMEHGGEYHVAMRTTNCNAEKPLIESNKVYIMVTLPGTTTETVPTSVHESTLTSQKPETLQQKSFIVFFTASVIIIISLFVGILCWFYRSYPRKQDAENPAVQNNRAKQQGQCGRSSPVVVSCVEYGELDFQSRPQRDDRGKAAESTSNEQDGVEYAAIIFPQQKQTPCGRIRNKQQVPAVKA